MSKKKRIFLIFLCMVIVIIITAILFIINVWKFINNPASEVPVLTLLFNMIIYIVIIIMILHKNEITLEDYIQKQIEKYKNKKLE